MATKRPSFLKRQKEMKRNVRAQEKREARRERKEARVLERHSASASDSLAEGSEPIWDPEL